MSKFFLAVVAGMLVACGDSTNPTMSLAEAQRLTGSWRLQFAIPIYAIKPPPVCEYPYQPARCIVDTIGMSFYEGPVQFGPPRKRLFDLSSGWEFVVTPNSGVARLHMDRDRQCSGKPLSCWEALPSQPQTFHLRPDSREEVDTTRIGVRLGHRVLLASLVVVPDPIPQLAADPHLGQRSTGFFRTAGRRWLPFRDSTGAGDVTLVKTWP